MKGLTNSVEDVIVARTSCWPRRPGEASSVPLLYADSVKMVELAKKAGLSCDSRSVSPSLYPDFR